MKPSCTILAISKPPTTSGSTILPHPLVARRVIPSSLPLHHHYHSNNNNLPTTNSYNHAYRYSVTTGVVRAPVITTTSTASAVGSRVCSQPMYKHRDNLSINLELHKSLSVSDSSTKGLVFVPPMLRCFSSRLGVPTSCPSSSFSSLSTNQSPTCSTVTGYDIKCIKEFDSSAFIGVGTFKLIRTALIFSVCKIKPLVVNSDQIVAMSRKYLGDNFTFGVLKKTFFAHFCGGEKTDDLRHTLVQLQREGVGSILDYAAEKEVSSDGNSAVEDKSMFDTNMKCSMDAITQAAQQPKGFIAVKFTSLVSPNLLLVASLLVKAAQTQYDRFAEHAMTASVIGKTTEHNNTKKKYLTRQEFTAAAIALVQCSSENARVVFDEIKQLGENEGYQKGMGVEQEAHKDSVVTMYSWMAYMSPDRLGRGKLEKWLHCDIARCSTVCKNECKGGKGGLRPLTDSECETWTQGRERIDRLGSSAESYDNVSLLIDAEQTYLQKAIDYLTLEQQAKRNKKRGVIYNTYQAYLRDSRDRMLTDHEFCCDVGVRNAVKIVRGAYMKTERQDAIDGRYGDPINPDIVSTHVNFDACVSTFLDRLNTTDVMICSHNENSVLNAIRILEEKGLNRAAVPVCFAQLYGMCDHISLTLGRQGFHSFKYLPYGPIQDVIPYLLRRAVENSDLLGGSTKETKLILKELTRRGLSQISSFRQKEILNSKQQQQTNQQQADDDGDSMKRRAGQQ
eukprot:GHVQ01033998.1.p1 GENE.GHVQ01033998.1~~GHVQ01033998.1.p1  ORF type:complete len:732 (+),score=133.07 GHVQ01033998.1:520-2715(+)